MKVSRPAVVSGVLGVVAAAAATGVVVERHRAGRSRSVIETATAPPLGASHADREDVVYTDDGVALHVEEVGPRDAPMTVVFVHGYTLDLRSFLYQRRALRAHFGDSIRMVFYDQRSHGRSTRSSSAASTIEQLGRDLHSVLDAVAPDGPITLVGHSMGGMTVMALAEAHPELFCPNAASSSLSSSRYRIGSVVLINTSSGNMRSVTLGLPSYLARISGPVMPMILRRAVKQAELVERTRRFGRELAALITKKLSFASADVPIEAVQLAADMISRTRVEVVADFFPSLMSHDGSMGLMNLTGCDVLVIGSTRDAITPLSHSETIAAALPHEEFVVVEQTGHLLMLERPDAVTEPLTRLLDRALAAPAPGGCRQVAQ